MYGKGRVTLLSEETLALYNVDVKALSPGSHFKVCVQCTKCNEKFTREYRNLHQLHACPTHMIRAEDDVKLKWCNGCSSWLTYNCFKEDATKYDGLRSICQKCNKLPDVKGKAARKTPSGWLKWVCERQRASCKDEGIPFDLDYDFLLELNETQEGRCHYSKLPLEFGSKGLKSAYLELLDPNKGYIKGNVVLASRAMDWAKNNQAETVKYLIELMSSLASYVRLECKTISPLGKLPFRKRTFDAAFDIHSAVKTTVNPKGYTSVNTDLIVSAPDGFYYTIEGRSSLGMKGIIPFRGVIDSTYQGELIVALTNHSDVPYEVEVGDRIAQIVLHPIIHADFAEVSEFAPVCGGRATDGFGSSGR